MIAMRDIGVDHQGLVKFTYVMNVLPPMNENAYCDNVKLLCDATETVANASMCKAALQPASGVKEFYEQNEGFYDIAVSGDRTK